MTYKVWMLYISTPNRPELIYHRWTKADIEEIYFDALLNGIPEDYMYMQQVTLPVKVVA